jgi:photosystem II stability/assembly factor-like uncharacterized protein
MIKGGTLSPIVCAVLLAFLLGCEAPLVLDRVENQTAQPTRRSDLFQAAASNSDALVVVGSRGAVITSNDRGETWQRQVLEGKPFLMAVTTCPDGSFVALDYGRVLWFSDVRATEWHSRPISTFETVQTLSCDPRGNLWVVGSFSTILHSTDRGQTWTESSLDDDLHFTSIQFVDEDTVFLTGEFGVVVRSTDGGESWERLEPLADEFYPQDAYFHDRDVGWVIGLAGTIMVTTDGGTSWGRQDTGTTAPLYKITKNGDKLYVVGGNGTVLRSTLAGVKLGKNNWTEVQHQAPIRFYLRGVAPVGDTHLLVAGGAGALFVIPTDT